MKKYVSINPENNEVLNSYDFEPLENIKEKINLGQKAFQINKYLSFEERGEFLLEFAEVLARRKEQIAKTITLEMGKLIKSANSEIDKCIETAKYYAKHSKNFLMEELLESTHQETKLIYQPLGIIYGIMPWNFPFWQALRFAIPTIMAGNSVLVKHAENCPTSALLIQDCFNKTGFPKGIYQNLFIDYQTSDDLIANPLIQGVSITGSTKAGKEVASNAGKSIKKIVLELGGSDPFIVLEDANLEHAVENAANGRFQNNGQTCIAAKRIIIQDSIFESFKEKFIKKISGYKVGSPLDGETKLGPLARKDLLETIHNQVLTAISEGEEIILGGNIIEGKGNFMEATIFISKNKNSVLRKKELFGPVATLVSFASLEEMIEIANETEFGLGASLWTQNKKLASELVTKIDAGSIHVNSMVRSEASVPFGGMKMSGLGKEIGYLGIREFTVQKVINLDFK